MGKFVVHVHENLNPNKPEEPQKAATETSEQSDEPTVFSLEIKDAEHQAILRLQQEEIIQELRALVHSYEILAQAVEHTARMMETQSKVTEAGLRLVGLVPVMLCFLFTGSYFFYLGKISEPFFGTLLFVLMLPFLGQWIERAITMLPVVGNVLTKKDDQPRQRDTEPK